LELIKDYDLGVNNQPGKANVVADALSRMTYLNGLIVETMPFDLYEELNKLNLRLTVNTGVVAMKWIQCFFKIYATVKRRTKSSKKLREI
jgi:hypothetical protein